ncbi:MAG TPA: hypothetical protein VGO93_23825 [Candidatus Xenobia bacterium]
MFKRRFMGLLLSAGLMLGVAAPASAQYHHHYHHRYNSGLSISVGTAPLYGSPYQSYNGYYYYPSYSAPSSAYPIIQYNNSWGWWDGGHHWHHWNGPHRWEHRR